MESAEELEKVVQMLKGRAQKVQAAGGSLDVLRSSYEEMMLPLPVDGDAAFERVSAGGVPADWVTTPGVSDKVLLYLHGGGYVFGSPRTHRAMFSRLSRASGMRVLGLDYRLSPENSFPAPVEDAAAAYRWLLSQGVEPRHIAVGGDSAGGGLVASTLVCLRYFGEPLPAAGVCISPWADMEAIGESMTANVESDPNVRKEGLRGLAKLYLAGKDPRTPLAAPIYADLSGLPPMLIQVGSIETLLDDSTRLAERAESAGVEVELEVWDDMVHVWHLFAPILGEGQRAIERVGGFLREHTS